MSAEPDARPRNKVNVLGVLIDPTTIPDGTAQVMRWIAEKQRTYVCVTGVHGIMESQRHVTIKQIHNSAGMVVPDGMPLVYISRAAGHRDCGRVYGPSFMLEVCRASVKQGYRHFLFGTTPQTLTDLTDKLCRQIPGLLIVGSCAPPFRALTESEQSTIVSHINGCAPDIVWVGLSTPKQEQWMADNRSALNAPVLIGVGAAFDFHSGKVRQSPRWMQPLCLEWLFRLIVEPKRLWRRYLVNNPQFLVSIALQYLRFKQY